MPRSDRHHCFFERKWYVAPEDLTLRRHHLLIPKLDYDVHHNVETGLHANVSAPPKPNRSLTLGAVAFMHELPYYTPQTEAIKQLAGHFAENTGKYAELSGRIADNLFSQLTYIELGIVNNE